MPLSEFTLLIMIGLSLYGAGLISGALSGNSQVCVLVKDSRWISNLINKWNIQTPNFINH